MDKGIISVWVENEVGILSKVSALFGELGANIDSLAVGVSERFEIARMTIVTYAETETIDSVLAKLNTLKSVVKVKEISSNESVSRELALIMVEASEEKRSNIINIVEIFRAQIIDVGYCTMTVEISGDKDKIDALEDLLTPFGIREIVRTGLIAIDRGIRKVL